MEELSTDSTEEKDDWEEEWEDNVEELVKKATPVTNEKKSKPVPKATSVCEGEIKYSSLSH